jgi:hypothetical protein
MKTFRMGGSSKGTLLPVAIYYFILLMIAVSWTQKGLVEPNAVLRVLFTLFFALPLFWYRYFAPIAITVFSTIRLFSVAPFGYLPSTPAYYFYLVLLLYIYDLTQKNSVDRKNFSYSRSSKRLIAFLIVVVLSNAINLLPEYTFLTLLAIALLLQQFIRSEDELTILEIGFMIVTFCLSIYASIFSSDFLVKTAVSKEFIERSYWSDPNYLGCVLVIGIVVSFYFFMNRVKDKLVLRISYLVVAASGYLTLGMLASRGAFVSAIVPTLYILYKKTNSIKNLVYVAVFVVMVIAALSRMDYFAGLFARINSDDATGSGRTEIWQESFTLFLRSNIFVLLFGGGTDYANVLCGRAFDMRSFSPHNNYLAVLYDYGIVGLAMFLLIIASWLKNNVHNALAVSLILVFVITSFSLVPLMYLPFWCLIMLIEREELRGKGRVVQWSRSRLPGQNPWDRRLQTNSPVAGDERPGPSRGVRNSPRQADEE